MKKAQSATKQATRSGLYRGTVRHRRFAGRPHAFRNRVSYFYLDLSEIPRLFSRPGWFSYESVGLFSFRRRHYLGDPRVSLDESVRECVETRTGERPLGPIRMLTQISYWGFCFNPVTFYYCFTADGADVAFIVAEITNTPWGERHAYVMKAAESEALRFEFAKDFHVSPFMPMEQTYRWAFSTPADSLTIHMENRDSMAPSGPVAFDATLSLRRTDWSTLALARFLARQPFMTAQSLFWIYAHAAALWLKRNRLYDHPGNGGRPRPRPPSGSPGASA